MRISKSIFALIAILLCGIAKAQSAGGNCNYPLDLLSSADTCTGTIVAARVQTWYSFLTVDHAIEFSVEDLGSANGTTDKLVLYAGNCNALVPLDSANRLSNTTIVKLKRNNLPLGRYFVKAIHSGTPIHAPPTTTKVCLKQLSDPIFCGYDLFDASQRNSPGYTVQMTAQDQYIYNYVHTHSTISGPFTIPVVVHVLHFGDTYGVGDNISYDQILWQIAGMNAAFQHDYANYNQEVYGHNYPYGYRDYSTNPQVRFCLAKTGRDSALNTVPFYFNTMSGDTESGVMRYDLTQAPFNNINNVGTLNEYEISNPTDEQALIDVTRPGTEFPVGMYLNIYLVPDLCDGNGCNNISDPTPSLVGIGTMTPSSVAGLDGVVFRSDVFGDNSVVGNNYPLFSGLTQGKIMDHEAGHYLGLYHTFQPDSNQQLGCYGMFDTTSVTDRCDQHGDYCCDTPPDANANVLPYTPTTFVNSCNEIYMSSPANHRDMNENYMDYSDDEYYNTFTFDQSMRISAMLDVGGPRHSLVTASNHALTGVTNVGACHCCLLAAHIALPNDSTCIGANVQLFTPSGNGFCATSWNWSFPGGTPSSGTGTTPSTSYAAAGTYTIYLTATNGVDSITDSATIYVVIPTVKIERTNTNLSVCQGTQQNLYLHFYNNLPPNTVSICNSSNQVVATLNDIWLDTAIVLVPVTATDSVFHICSAYNALTCQIDTFQATAYFHNQPCCPNLFADGDFEDWGAGCNITPATTQQVTSNNCTLYSPSYYSIHNPTTSYGGWPIVPGNTGVNGLSMFIDGWSNPQIIGNPNHVEIWRDSAMLINNTTYSLQFDYSGNHAGLGSTTVQPAPGYNLYLQLKINGVFVGTPVRVPTCSYNSPWRTFVMDYYSTLPSGKYRICLCQVQVYNTGINFSLGAFDYLIDNLTIRAKDIPTVYAGIDTVICPGGIATIGSNLNSPYGDYTWSPINFITCDTCYLTTANPDSTYNYVLTNHLNGCVVSDTVQVGALNVFAGNDTSSCGNTPITLTASVTGNVGSYTILWQPTLQTTASISVAPYVPTYYIVIVTDTLTGCTVTDSVLVSPSSFTASINSVNLCTGNAATLTASTNGGNAPFTYQWLPNNQTTSSILVTQAGVYTVIVTDASGCVDTAQTTVTSSAPPSVTASANPNPACIGSNVQLNTVVVGNGPLSYQWNPSTALSSDTISNPLISNFTGSPNTYVVQVTDVFGCVGSAIVTIIPDYACCVAAQNAPPIISNTTITGSVAINQNVTIVGAVTFNAVDMPIISGSTITVTPNATLQIIGQSHLYACQQLWKGIHVQSGGTLIINGTSTVSPLIEDADTAIHVEANSSVVLNNAIFNKNYVAAYLQPNASTASFQATRCRFTSRSFQTTPSVALLTGTYLTAQAPATLLQPLAGNRPFSGIVGKDVNQMSVGVPITGALNIFDNMDHGIVVYNSNLFSRNNQFQNMLGRVIICQGPPAPCPPHPGIAILAIDQNLVVGNPTTYNSINVGGASVNHRNYFIDCYTAIDITNYVNIKLENDSVLSQNTVILPASVNQNGDHGIFIRTRYAQILNIRENGMLNQATAIQLILSGGGLGYKTVNVNKNRIWAGSTPTKFTNTGILALGVQAVLFDQLNYLNIDSNTVVFAKTCIRASSFKKSCLRIENNPLLHIRPIATAGVGPNQAGILVQNCEGALVIGNPLITSLGTTYQNSNHRNVRGIYIWNSSRTTVACNGIEYTGQSLVFEGACAYSTMRKNDMSFAYDGFVMRNAAIIGVQGDATHPIDNRWLGGFVNSETYVLNVNNINSPLVGSPIYVRNAPTYNPVNNQTNTNQQYVPIYVNSAFVAAVCPSSGTNTGDPTFNTLREAIATDQVVYGHYPEENEFANKKQLWEDLQTFPDLMLGDTILQNFNLDNSETAIGQLSKVESQTSTGAFGDAITTNNDVEPTSNPEANMQEFNATFLTSLVLGDDEIDSDQLADLTYIANQCPAQGGEVVWQARAMLDWVLHTHIEYEDTCVSVLRFAPSSEQQEELTSSDIHVFPNPTSGKITVNYLDANLANGRIELLDVTGRVLKTEYLPETSTSKVLDISNFDNGVYMYRIYDGSTILSVNILVLSK